MGQGTLVPAATFAFLLVVLSSLLVVSLLSSSMRALVSLSVLALSTPHLFFSLPLSPAAHDDSKAFYLVVFAFSLCKYRLRRLPRTVSLCLCAPSSFVSSFVSSRLQRRPRSSSPIPLVHSIASALPFLTRRLLASLFLLLVFSLSVFHSAPAVTSLGPFFKAHALSFSLPLFLSPTFALPDSLLEQLVPAFQHLILLQQPF